MRKEHADRCPTLADLLSASEDLLPPPRQGRVLAHLAQCEACRVQVQRMEGVLGAPGQEIPDSPRALAYRPARQWHFVQRLHAHKQERIPRTATATETSPHWFSIAAIVFITIVLPFQSTSATVRPDDLLTRAGTQERGSGTGRVQRVRIRWTPTVGASRATWAWLDGARPSVDVTPDLTNASTAAQAPPAVPPAAPPTPENFAALFAQHRLDWQRPLSIEAFRAWRGMLRHKRDQVIPQDDGMLVLRTMTSEGTLRLVEVAVHQDTYRVARQTLIFDGIGRVDIEDAGQTVRRDDPATAAPAAAPDTDALDRAELDARLVLREAELDLDQRVWVSREQDRIWVRGIVSPATRRTVGARLVALPYVEVELQPRPGMTDARPTYGRVAPGPNLTGWLQTQFAEQPTRRRFLRELTRRVAVVQDRLNALDALARRYSAAGTRSSTPEVRARLRRLLDLHYRGLNESLEELESYLSVLFGSTDGRPLAQPNAPADWRARAAAGLTQAETLTRLLQEFVAHDDVPVQSGPDVPLEQTFGTLWETINGPSTR